MLWVLVCDAFSITQWWCASSKTTTSIDHQNVDLTIVSPLLTTWSRVSRIFFFPHHILTSSQCAYIQEYRRRAKWNLFEYNEIKLTSWGVHVDPVSELGNSSKHGVQLVDITRAWSPAYISLQHPSTSGVLADVWSTTVTMAATYWGTRFSATYHGVSDLYSTDAVLLPAISQADRRHMCLL